MICSILSSGSCVCFFASCFPLCPPLYVLFLLPPSLSLSLSRDNRRAPLLCHFSGRQPLIHVPIIPSAQGAIGAGHKRHKQSSISLSSLCSRPPPRLHSLSPPLIRLSFCRASTVGRALPVFPLHPPHTYHSSPASSFLLLISLLFVYPLCLQSLRFFFCTPHAALVTRRVYLLKHRENSSKFEGLFTELDLFGFLSSAPKRTSMRIISLFREFESGFVSGVDHRI